MYNLEELNFRSYKDWLTIIFCITESQLSVVGQLTPFKTNLALPVGEKTR